MYAKPINYRAYLLRLWKVRSLDGDGQANGWRASLEEPHTGKQLAFATLERLFTFLVDQVEQPEERDAQKVKEGPM